MKKKKTLWTILFLCCYKNAHFLFHWLFHLASVIYCQIMFYTYVGYIVNANGFCFVEWPITQKKHFPTFWALSKYNLNIEYNILLCIFKCLNRMIVTGIFCGKGVVNIQGCWKQILLYFGDFVGFAEHDWWSPYKCVQGRGNNLMALA